MPIRSAKDGLKAKKKAEEEARLAEEARVREEERAKEEARLAAKAAEKAKIDAEIRAQLSSPEGQLRDLTKWLSSVPLSKKCYKRMDRELSDGVAVAEIIAHYCPDICDVRQYYPWNSSRNKRSNWDALNRKVFPELGFQLKDDLIENVVQPFSCRKYKLCSDEPLIYKVLRQVRDGIARINPSVYDYRKLPDFKSAVPICEAPVKPNNQFKRKPRVDLDSSPPFSKIEIQIANGMFDEEDKKNEENQKYDYFGQAENGNGYCEFGATGNVIDWVEFHGCGGEIVFDEAMYSKAVPTYQA
ncbi:uncharacterized protein LOC118434899 [Folsomia candida]|nr:uncharacterized protein LOC118434899 [Folsomia candida]XP_035705365.1 uncharacterized protein LOC118434899 [Folsomia candida]